MADAQGEPTIQAVAVEVRGGAIDLLNRLNALADWLRGMDGMKLAETTPPVPDRPLPLLVDTREALDQSHNCLDAINRHVGRG